MQRSQSISEDVSISSIVATPSMQATKSQGYALRQIGGETSRHNYQGGSHVSSLGQRGMVLKQLR